MAIMFVYLAAIATLAAIYLSRQGLAAKPWLDDVRLTDLVQIEASKPTTRTGLVVFLGVASSLFALLISAYLMRMDLPDWRPLPSMKILWFNTGMLVAGSFALQAAVFAERQGAVDAARAALAIAGISTSTFVVGQTIAWYWLLTDGYSVEKNPANAFFFLITGVHGLHVLGGLVALGRTTGKAMNAAPPVELLRSLELCATYWHFLLVVWLVLLALLTGLGGGLAAFCRGLLPS